MTNIEVDRMKQEVAHLTWPHGRLEPRVDFVLSAAQLDRLIESVRELHRQKRELHDQLHRLRRPNA